MRWTKESRKEFRARIALRLLAMKGQSDTLERLHRAIEYEIGASSRRIQRAASSDNDDFIEAITDEECLAVEELLGLAFVAAQSFINSIRSEIIMVGKVYSQEFGSNPKFPTQPKEILKIGAMLPGAKCSAVEAIDAVANYWKHSDEWRTVEQKSSGRLREIWDPAVLKDNQKRTAETVIALGLTPNSTGNLRKAAKALGVKSYEDLSQIRQTLSNWAAELLKKARTGFGVKP